MILRTVYPCRIDGVLPGKRKVETVYVLREKMLDIRVLDEAPVESIRIDSTTTDYNKPLPVLGPVDRIRRDLELGLDPQYDTQTNRSTYYAIGGSGCHVAEPVDNIFGNDPKEWMVKSLFGLKGAHVSLRVMPHFSRIEQDHGIETEAKMERVASKLSIHGDKVYQRIYEPFVGVGLDGNGKTKEIRVFHSSPDDHKLVYTHFRLDQLEQARTLAAMRPGPDDDLGKFDGRYAIQVLLPEALAFDPDRPVIVGMAKAVVASVKVILGDLDRPQIEAWMDLRDSVAKYQTGKDRMGGADPILKSIGYAMDVLAPLERMKPSTVAEYRSEIYRLSRGVPDDVDLDAIAEAFAP